MYDEYDCVWGWGGERGGVARGGGGSMVMMMSGRVMVSVRAACDRVRPVTSTRFFLLPLPPAFFGALADFLEGVLAMVIEWW